MEITREVEFNGAKLLALEINGKYYVSMRHVCQGLGLTESQRKYIVNKFNKDEIYGNTYTTYRSTLISSINHST